MTRGHPPEVAIGEAKKQAAAWELLVIEIVCAIRLPFDFIIHKDGKTSIVRVRRLKYARFSVEQIYRQCSQELRELAGALIPEDVVREIWIRGPDRKWHRYRVTVDNFMSMISVSYIPTPMPEKPKKAGKPEETQEDSGDAANESGKGGGDPGAGPEMAKQP